MVDWSGLGRGMVDAVMPNPPTWEGAKQLAKGMLTPPDPYEAAGEMVTEARQGNYGKALEAGMGMPGLPSQGMFYNEYSPGFNRDRLHAAIHMMAQDVPEREIWAKTLTGLEPSGHWIQEGSDHLARLDLSKLPQRQPLGAYYQQMKQAHPTAPPLERAAGARAAFRLGAPDPVNLSTILHHPDLYRNMPLAHGIQVQQEVHPARLGSLNTNTGVLSVARERNPLKSILHEIQHYIDNDAGFLQDGGDASQFLRSPWREHMLPGETPHDAYLRLAGEQRANAVEARAHLTPEQRAMRHFKDDMIPFDQQIIRIR